MSRRYHVFNCWCPTLIVIMLAFPSYAAEDVFAPYQRYSVERIAINGRAYKQYQRYPMPGFPEIFFRWQQQCRDDDGMPQKVKVSAFRGKSGTTSEQFSMSISGEVWCRTFDAFSVSGSGEVYAFDKEANDELDRLLSILPPSTIGAPLENLICISSKNKEKQWITYVYDITNLDNDVKHLLEMIGFCDITQYGKRKIKSGMRPYPRIRKLPESLFKSPEFVLAQGRRAG